MVTSSMPTLHIGHEDKNWYATGDCPDGSKFLAVADSRSELDGLIREAATEYDWPGWLTYCTSSVVQ